MSENIIYDQIDAMTPGREMNELIGEIVVGNSPQRGIVYLAYSEAPGAMMEVIEAMASKQFGMAITISELKSHVRTVVFIKGKIIEGSSGTNLPFVICVAALKAVMAQEGGGE